MSKPTVTEYILAQAIVKHWEVEREQGAYRCPHCNAQQPATRHHGEAHTDTCPVILARMVIEQAYPQEKKL